MEQSVYTLTDFGAKAAMQLNNPDYKLPQDFDEKEKQLLISIYLNGYVPDKKEEVLPVDKLFQNEIIELQQFDFDKIEEFKVRIKEKYRTTPVRHVYRLMIEYTTLCNLNCPSSCFKAFLPKITENNPDDLKKTIDYAKLMGIEDFVFNGGEVIKYGKGWLEIAAYISQTGHGVNLITNGWWGTDDIIETADGTFHGVNDVVRSLKKGGIKAIMFSIDGLGEEHDIFRNSPGLYNKVIYAVKAAKEVGIVPYVSICLHDGIKDKDRFFKEITRIFDLQHNPGDLVHAKEKMKTTRVLIENIDDSGNGINYYKQLKNPPYLLSDSNLLNSLNEYCKGITKGMKLSLRANGEIEPCTLGAMGKGFGNIHHETLPVIVNKMRESPVYRLFKENKFNEYAQYVDKEIFGTGFFQKCTIIAIISSLAFKIDELRNSGKLNKESIREINIDVAKQTGFL